MKRILGLTILIFSVFLQAAESDEATISRLRGELIMAVARQNLDAILKTKNELELYSVTLPQIQTADGNNLLNLFLSIAPKESTPEALKIIETLLIENVSPFQKNKKDLSPIMQAFGKNLDYFDVITKNLDPQDLERFYNESTARIQQVLIQRNLYRPPSRLQSGRGSPAEYAFLRPKTPVFQVNTHDVITNFQNALMQEDIDFARSIIESLKAGGNKEEEINHLLRFRPDEKSPLLYRLLYWDKIKSAEWLLTSDEFSYEQKKMLILDRIKLTQGENEKLFPIIFGLLKENKTDAVKWLLTETGLTFAQKEMILNQPLVVSDTIQSTTLIELLNTNKLDAVYWLLNNTKLQEHQKETILLERIILKDEAQLSLLMYLLGRKKYEEVKWLLNDAGLSNELLEKLLTQTTFVNESHIETSLLLELLMNEDTEPIERLIHSFNLSDELIETLLTQNATSEEPNVFAVLLRYNLVAMIDWLRSEAPLTEEQLDLLEDK